MLFFITETIYSHCGVNKLDLNENVIIRVFIWKTSTQSTRCYYVFMEKVQRMQNFVKLIKEDSRTGIQEFMVGSLP